MRKTNQAATSVAILMMASFAVSCSPSGLRIPTGRGPEDLDRIAWKGDHALVTGTGTRRLWGPKNDGRLEVYRPGQPSFETVVSAKDLGFPFCPVGLASVERSADPRWVGKPLLYVVNLFPRPGEKGSEVEVFEVSGRSLRHLARLGPNLCTGQPNGIAAFRDGSVYVSELTLATRRQFPRRPGEAPCKQRNTIARYQPPATPRGTGKWTLEIECLPGSNGLAPGPGERTLLACSYFRRSVFEFDRDPTTGALVGSPREILKFPYHLDNLKLHPEKGLYEVCGQHSSVWTALHLLTGLPCSTGSSSEFRWDGKEVAALRHRGTRHRGDRSGPSTAITVGDRLYVAHIRTPGVLAVE